MEPQGLPAESCRLQSQCCTNTTDAGSIDTSGGVQLLALGVVGTHKAVKRGSYYGCMAGCRPCEACSLLRRSVCGLCGCTGMAADVLAKGVLLAPVLSAWGETCVICTLCGRHCMPVEQHYEVVQESVLTGSPVQGPSYAALIAHRVWSRHPTRHRWAGFILAGAAVW